MTITPIRGERIDFLSLVKKLRNELLDRHGSIAYANTQAGRDAFHKATKALDDLFNEIYSGEEQRL